MKTDGNPDMELFDVDSSNIMSRKTTGYFGQHGFLLCRHGSISLMTDECVYDVHAGDMYIYPAFTYTQIKHYSADFQGVAGMADFDFVLSSIEPVSNTRSHIYIRFHPRVSLTPEQFHRIEKIIECIRERKDIHTGLNRRVLSAFIQALCYDIIDVYITNTPVETKKQTRRDKIFQSFLMSLYNNFRNHRDVRYYAEQQNLTPRYFATLVHDVSGKTPLQWISMFVIIEAKRLLSNPSISVKEAADRLNFTERSSFGHYFKLYAGCSPSEYRNATLIKE